jgi:DNA primase
MLDPSRNGTGATIVAPYSPRARAEAPVSFPVPSEDLRSIRPGDYTVATVPGRLGEPGPARWAAAAGERAQRVPSTLLAD